MKCEAKRCEPGVFHPMELTLKFENEAEAGAFYAVFNHTRVTDVIEPLVDHESIRRAIDKAGGKAPYYADIHERLSKAFG
jgi:hypothetical protein